MSSRPSGLGRGLGALIRDGATAAPEKPAAEGAQRLPVAAIRKSPWQPRHQFDAEPLAELVASVKERGVLQPLLVRKIADGYELIAGERRLRAAGEAGLREVPALVLDVSDREALEIALVENLQRSDLNLMEEAEGYRALADQFSLTQEQIAQRVGKARPTIANALRLLELADGTKRLVAERQLTPGHAKALLGIADAREQQLLAARAVAEGLSVREVERLVKCAGRPHKKPRAQKSDIPPEHLNFLVQQLHQKLGTAVRIEPTRTLANGRKTRGRVEIDFYSADELDRILVILGVAGEL
jgi:ParB family chromosome partitioning protein